MAKNILVTSLGQIRLLEGEFEALGVDINEKEDRLIRMMGVNNALPFASIHKSIGMLQELPHLANFFFEEQFSPEVKEALVDLTMANQRWQEHREAVVTLPVKSSPTLDSKNVAWLNAILNINEDLLRNLTFEVTHHRLPHASQNDRWLTSVTRESSRAATVHMIISGSDCTCNRIVSPMCIACEYDFRYVPQYLMGDIDVEEFDLEEFFGISTKSLNDLIRAYL